MPGGSWRIDPFVEYPQDARGRAPDVALRERHRIVRALHAAKFLAVDLMVQWVHQERQRHLEGVVDLRLVDVQCKTRPHPRQRRQDAEPEAGAVEVEIAD